MMMDGADYVDWSSIQLFQGDEMSWNVWLYGNYLCQSRVYQFIFDIPLTFVFQQLKFKMFLKKLNYLLYLFLKHIHIVRKWVIPIHDDNKLLWQINNWLFDRNILIRLRAIISQLWMINSRRKIAQFKTGEDNFLFYFMLRKIGNFTPHHPSVSSSSSGSNLMEC